MPRKTTAATVPTVQIEVSDLTVGQVILHKGDWVPVKKIVESDVFEGEYAIYTTKGLFSVSYLFETVDIQDVQA